MADQYSIASDPLNVSVKLHGAELCALRAGGQDLLWAGDPAVWGRQAPVLFPVVGALKGGRLLHRGKAYPMPRHGFARDRDFSLVRLTGHSCCMRLCDDAATRAMYPFPFRLEIGFRIDGPELTVRYELHNPGDSSLPAAFGAHPAFRWPLQPGVPRNAHWLEFEQPETGPLPELGPDGLLSGAARPSPLEGRRLRLREDLFKDDALIFKPVQSRAVRFSGPGAPLLEVSWDGFPQLGLWSCGAFLCIEPWRGYASPEGFDGEFANKPGNFLVSPGGTVAAQYSVKVLEPEIG
jgi:galactose mutarotase-like enzyme